jgi:hypothetical protein
MLFVADSTRNLLADLPDDLVLVGDFEIRGRQARMRVWSLGEDEKSDGAITSDREAAAQNGVDATGAENGVGAPAGDPPVLNTL